MKITGIEIGEYRQFKNIKFDFTYPKDHSKAGQPLEKVCFIGQSGTGKTTLLNIIWDFIDVLNDSSSVFPILDESNWFLRDLSDKCRVNFIVNKNSYIYNDTSGLILNDENPLLSDINKLKNLGMYLPDNILEVVSSYLYQSYEEFEQTGVVSSNKLRSSLSQSSSGHESSFFKLLRVVDFRYVPRLLILYSYFDDIIKFDNDLKNAALSIINNSSGLSASRLMETFVKWKTENINPRTKYAEDCLDKILRSFHLRVDTDAADAPIVIKTNSGTAIDGAWLSTGTKQIIATALALYKFDSNSAVILFDEPERSLFPDIQRELIGHYTSLAPEAQFFFATHSPIIASAFEPCERFILYFNENGEVNFHKGVAPEGDDPNDILRQDFDMSPLMLQKGVDEYQRYLDLATKIMNEPDKKRKMELISQRAAIGNEYNFSATDETN